MNSTSTNGELAYRVLDHIESHPEQYNPDTEISFVDLDGYITDAADGIQVADFTGWTCLLSGDRLDTGDHGHDGTGVLTADGVSHDAHDRAVALLGLTSDDNDWVLGLDAGRDIASLRSAVAETFGSRSRRTVTR